MPEYFIQSNPGLQSRFKNYIYFDDYNAKELSLIFLDIAAKNNSNARLARNILEKAIVNQNNRLAIKESVPSKDELQTLTREDLESGYKQIYVE